jgi:hypothetical protein
MIDRVFQVCLVVLLAWTAVSLHQLARGTGEPAQVYIANPVAITAKDDLSVRGQMLIDIDRMPFDRGDPIHVKLENETGLSPWRVILDR